MGSDDGGYALVSVIGLGMAILLSVGAVSAYSLQAMRSAGSTQGFHASVQAAQAGVDQFVAKLNTAATAADVTTAINAGTAWQPIPGSQDGAGASCAAVSGGSLPPNCPKFKYTATPSGSSYDVVSTGYSRGDVRSVKVTLRQRALTDYLYYSEIEAADPADRFVYPNILGLGAAPIGCDQPDWPTPRPAGQCVVPTWRSGDLTEGSRVHTHDVFSAVGSPEFDSRVTAAIPTCATTAALCMQGPHSAQFNVAPLAYADDLTMPASGLGDIAAAAGTALGGCTYYGPTRIHFENAKLRVWSPQTPADPPATPDDQKCGGGVPSNLLSTVLDVNVSGSASLRLELCNVLGLNLLALACSLLGIGSPATATLAQIQGSASLLAAANLGPLGGLFAPGNLVDVRPDMAIYVRDNLPADAIPNPLAVQCLVGSALGMYSTADTNAIAGLLGNGVTGALNSPLAECTKGKLFVDGTLDGRSTIGVDNDILIMSNQRYAGSDDKLGMVANGSIEVYNPLQCTLAASTCLSLDSNLPITLLNSLRTAGTGNLTTIVGSIPGARSPVTVEAAMIALNGRFGVQLPVLSPSIASSLQSDLLTKVINLNLDPPKLTVNGSVAQRYRGLLAADLAYARAVLQTGQRTLALLEADVNFGYQWDLHYDERFLTSAPLYLPQRGTARFDQVSFAEVAAVQ